MRRREFLEKTGKAVALAAVTGGAGMFFHNRTTARYTPLVVKSRSFEVAADTAFPKIALAEYSDPATAVSYALDAVGGIKRFVKPGEKVTIKPNIGWDRAPEQAANTNPVLVAEMVRICLEAGASDVVVTDISCNDPRRCFLRSGIRDAAEKAGARVLLPRPEDFVTTDLGGELLTVWPVLKHFIQTDRLINMPIVKQHSLSQCTIGMKNLYGILGGRRNQLHQQIDQSIVDLTAFCKPTLTVVDATRVLMRNGPTGGNLDDVAIENSVICATDPVAADARGAEFLGIDAERVKHIVLAEKTGLGTADYRGAGYKEINQ
ncbi:MAG: DUF362 domain-containing protein [Candidatus Zixiibacteriota bacterium]|nr:MAG: DUF362 domain-containing protein [candidate division Zixibacteria bacterium]